MKAGRRSSTLQTLGRRSTLHHGDDTGYTSETYKPTRTEKGVFNTPPYSGRVKHLWAFKDEATASTSCQSIWTVFEEYKECQDFVGMDICRKFLQMGRTRSLRYALRPGGRKYLDGVEIPRTGQVHDEAKLAGSKLFEHQERLCWQDPTYWRLWLAWGGKDFERKEPSMQ